MYRCFTAISTIAGLAVAFLFVNGKDAFWEPGPKYGMPTLLVADDGQHYLDGGALDPLNRWLVQNGCEEEVWAGLLSGAGVIVVIGLIRRGGSSVGQGTSLSAKRATAASASLDKVLMMWNRVDPYTRRHLLNSGALIMGRPGSAKTTGSGLKISRAIISDPLSSMLILAAKPEDADMWKRLFNEARRELLVFEPGGSLRCNGIDFIQRHGGDTREVVSYIITSGECLRSAKSGGGDENGSFFEDEKRRDLHHAVEVLRHAGVAVSAPSIQEFITTAALTPDQVNNETWRERSFHNQCLRKAAASVATKPETEQHDFMLANNAWTKEWPAMAGRTRSCVLANILNTLFYFNSGIARELLSTTTNCSPLDMFQGKSILVNCPSCEYGDSGALVSTSLKFLTQKAVLARQFKPGDFYNVIWADEAWQVTTSFDQHYAATSRSHGGAMVYLVQSRDSFYSALKGDNGKHFANALMGMFHHKVFHALGSPDDAEYAASLLGKQRELSFGGSSQTGTDAFDTLMGNSSFSGSFNEAYQPVLQPGFFLGGGLRCGGPENRFMAEAIVIRSGEPFASNGQNFIRASFSQR